MSLFTVAGVSTFNGKTKVRFANDLVSRFKILNKGGHQNIQLSDLPSPMTKAEVVTYLKTTSLMETPLYADAIYTADDKYNTSTVVTKLSAKSSALSLESIKARAGIVALTE